MFVGEILIVDDEVNEEYTDSWIIAEYLKEQNFSVIKKDTFPGEHELEGHKLSMVICDWMFKKGDKDGNAREVIAFLNKVQSKEFVPVFICTSLDRQEVEKYLADSKYNCTRYKDNDASSIFIVRKGDILKKEEDLFIVIKRQCDLNREDNNGLYILKMSEIEQTSTTPISINFDDNTIQILENTYQLNHARQNKINKQLKMFLVRQEYCIGEKFLKQLFKLLYLAFVIRKLL